MALGDGVRRNIASVEPRERRLFRDALLALNRRFFPGQRSDAIPGGVSFWFKQDEIHQATHVHGGPEFLPWHREIVNRLEEMLRLVNPQLSLHYWDWTQDPRSIPNSNLGAGNTGELNLFTTDFMGHGGSDQRPIGEPWLSAGYYVADTSPDRDRDNTANPADPPRIVSRSVGGQPVLPVEDTAMLQIDDYADFRSELERLHNRMHGFVRMGPQHLSFRDPFVFLLHSNVDRLFALWQIDPVHPQRLDPNTVYGTESNKDVLVDNVIQNVNHNILPWSGIPDTVRPWASPENQQVVKTYKHLSIVTPRAYDTSVPEPKMALPEFVSFGKVAQRDTKVRVIKLGNTGLADLSFSINASIPPPQGQPLSGFRWQAMSATISPGDSRNITIQFSPRAEGPFTNTLKVESNASGSPHSVAIRGIGLPREIQPL